MLTYSIIIVLSLHYCTRMLQTKIRRMSEWKWETAVLNEIHCTLTSAVSGEKWGVARSFRVITFTYICQLFTHVLIRVIQPLCNFISLRAESNLTHSFILTALNSATSVPEIPLRAMKSSCNVYIYYFVWPACFQSLVKCLIRFPWRMTTWAQGGLKLSKRRTLTGRRKLMKQCSISRSLL